MSTDAGTAPAFAPDRPVTILDVPIDESNERAVPLAAHLAEVWGVPIRLLHVSPSAEEATAQLDRAVAEARRCWPDGVFETAHLEGDDVAAAITGAIDDRSLLVVSTDNANAWSFKNSVAERLVDRAGRPLILLGPRAAEPHPTGDVIVAFDGRPASEIALEAAVALTAALDRDLWLVQVVPESSGPTVELHGEVGVDLQRRIDGLDPSLGPRWEVIHSNDPVNAIERFADRVGASFIAAAARGRTDVTRTTMSSITMGLVATAGRPVLVVGH